jgi:hypothetical protein
MEVERPGVGEGLAVKAAMEILGLSRSSYARDERLPGTCPKARSAEHREVSIKDKLLEGTSVPERCFLGGSSVTELLLSASEQ